MDGKQDATGVKCEDDEEAQEKKKLGLEQQWQERMNGIRECMFQEGPLFQVVLPDTSTCTEDCTLPSPTLTWEPPLCESFYPFISASRLSCSGPCFRHMLLQFADVTLLCRASDICCCKLLT